MQSSVGEAIERIFMAYRNDGEFTYDHTPGVYQLIGPPASSGRFLFTTKPTLIASAVRGAAVCGMIGRYGLPCRSDVFWMRTLIGNHSLLFLGDMDPVDLLIFWWLRDRLNPTRVIHVGISDSYIESLNVSIPESFVMKCSRSEQEAYSDAQHLFQEASMVVGDLCGTLLLSGRKVELDAIVSLVGVRCLTPCSSIDSDLG